MMNRKRCPSPRTDHATASRKQPKMIDPKDAAFNSERVAGKANRLASKYYDSIFKEERRLAGQMVDGRSKMAFIERALDCSYNGFVVAKAYQEAILKLAELEEENCSLKQPLKESMAMNVQAAASIFSRQTEARVFNHDLHEKLQKSYDNNGYLIQKIKAVEREMDQLMECKQQNEQRAFVLQNMLNDKEKEQADYRGRAEKAEASLKETQVELHDIQEQLKAQVFRYSVLASNLDAVKKQKADMKKELKLLEDKNKEHATRIQHLEANHPSTATRPPPSNTTREAMAVKVETHCAVTEDSPVRPTVPSTRTPRQRSCVNGQDLQSCIENLLHQRR